MSNSIKLNPEDYHCTQFGHLGYRVADKPGFTVVSDENGTTVSHARGSTWCPNPNCPDIGTRLNSHSSD